MAASQADLRSQLRRFGHETFRPGQERIIRDLLSRRDVLAVLPTGSGKSLVYQLAAQLLPGVTVVASPLIALMKDQVESIEEHGLAVSVVNSTQSECESEEELQEAVRGEAKLLYVTPERFDDDEFMAELCRTRVSLFVVDEAHCISEWGHDFRPSYLALKAAAAALGQPVLLALTATATPWVRREIVERLGMRDPDVVVRGVDRPNLFLEVRRVEAEGDDRRVLRELIEGAPDRYPPEMAARIGQAMRGSGIVYTATTKGAEETAEWLAERGIPADFYHGQRRKADRERVQEAFMGDRLRVIVATNAFGLGVDKPDVRFVVHRDVPGSLEAYYQEAGRAGRDGEFARCTVIYRPGDLGRAAFLSASGRLTREEVRRAHDGLVAHPDVSADELAQITGLGEADLARLVAVLLREGILQERKGRVRLLVPDFDPERVSLAEEERRKAYEHSRLEMVRGYVETQDCRRRYVLNYFGEEYEPERCAMCDGDLLAAGTRVTVEAATETILSPFEIGDRVAHETWGEGVVQMVADDSLTMLFEEVGYKTLATELVLDRSLLRRAT